MLSHTCETDKSVRRRELSLCNEVQTRRRRDAVGPFDSVSAPRKQPSVRLWQRPLTGPGCSVTQDALYLPEMLRAHTRTHTRVRVHGARRLGPSAIYSGNENSVMEENGTRCERF